MYGLSQPGMRRLAYGFWRYQEDQIAVATEMLALARESGIDHLDTADVYGGASGFGGSERLLGAIRGRTPDLLKGAIVATKVGIEPGVPYNSSSAYLLSACEGSLARLKVEHIDLLYIHRPDLLTHPEDLAVVLDRLVASGKVGAVGVSNFTVSQVEALSGFLGVSIGAHQLEFSATHVDPLFDGTLDQAMSRAIAVVAWSPLAGGRLAANRVVLDALERVGERVGASTTAVALAFLQKHPASVTPILGATNTAHLRECLKAGDVTLSRRDWYEIVEAARGARMP
jgi:6-dehydroglucose reductase